MDRRHFLMSGLALLAPRSSFAATAQIDILPEEKIGTIAPEIYSHFTEHLGGCVYDGIWVGEKSTIPNVGGIRKELIDRLKELKPAVIRWPGGCFADSYNWRDGVGPRDKRPRRTNFWADTPYLAKVQSSPSKFDPNEFGSNEFARLCKLVGAEPYFAGNLRALPAYDFYEWIEYCNSPKGSTTLADLRAQGGSPDPLNVQYWGVGNESWGCGGNFTGDEYAVEFRRYTEWVPKLGVPLKYIASGPNVADYDWTRSFFTKLVEKGPGTLKRVFGTALHYYCGSNNQKGRGSSVEFTDADWYGLLSRSLYMDELIRNHWAIMGEIDKDHLVKLVVDEWGAWHETDSSINPSFLWAYYPTLRDALVSGLTLDVFNRHADKVAMANAAQLVNNIHTSILASGDKFTVTPIFHVFAMYAAHQGGESVRTNFSTGEVHEDSAKHLPALSGSCSIHGKRAVLTVVNSHIKNAQETEIRVAGMKTSGAKATVLTATDIHAHNTFAEPHALEPQPKSVAAGPSFAFQFPPASVMKLEFDLA